MHTDEPLHNIQVAAKAVLESNALLIGAGAGMGVDSGLPDFRGNEGFWNAYPPLRDKGLTFIDMANPRWFDSNPQQAWGFYGHRLNLYRKTIPHDGFQVLLRWAELLGAKSFVFTSNVDGHFQKAGFNPSRITECHGSIHHLQCSKNCNGEIWENKMSDIEVDEDTLQAVSEMPHCPFCGEVARPNILMFRDFIWASNRSDGQEDKFISWLSNMHGKRLAIVECGAGTAIPTVRNECEAANGTLIRINIREPEGLTDSIGIQLGAAEALLAIDREIHALSK